MLAEGSPITFNLCEMGFLIGYRHKHKTFILNRTYAMYLLHTYLHTTNEKSCKVKLFIVCTSILTFYQVTCNIIYKIFLLLY